MRPGQARVFDLGYQAYAGPREGRNRARRAVFTEGVRTLLGIGRGGRAKILPALLFLAAIVPALVFTLVVTVTGAEGAVPGAADYYAVVGFVLVIFGAIMAPELLIADRRSNVLQLYLVRPLSSTDYVAARFLAFFSVVLALVYSGQVILQTGLILTAAEPLSYIRDNWLTVPRFLAAGAIFALFITAIPLAVATFASRRAYVAAFVIGAFMVSSFVTNGLVAAEVCDDPEPIEREDTQSVTMIDTCRPITGDAAPYISLLDLFQVPQSLNTMIFAEQEEGPTGTAVADLHRLFPIGTYAALTAVPCLLLWYRYRRLTL